LLDGGETGTVRHPAKLARRNMIGRILSWIILAAGVIAGSQFAHVSDLYIERLLGRLDELHRQVQAMRAQAQEAGLDLNGWIGRFERNEDPVVQRDAADKREVLAREQTTADDVVVLVGADLIHLPLEFARRADRALLFAVLERYEPALPAGPRGLVYTSAGLFVGLLLGALVAPRRRLRERHS
jgi:Protein of unknown function (DUF2937)